MNFFDLKSDLTINIHSPFINYTTSHTSIHVHFHSAVCSLNLGSVVMEKFRRGASVFLQKVPERAYNNIQKHEEEIV